LVFAGLSLILAGWRALDSGQLHYRNYWGGSVFAPFAIALGIAVLVILIARWRTLTETPPKLKGKAARRARRAAETKSPIDTFDKPWNP
jgi:hypothetical protein